jgi:hypothetical protein
MGLGINPMLSLDLEVWLCSVPLARSPTSTFRKDGEMIRISQYRI